MPWDFDNSKPIYLQLIEVLKFKIISGEMPIGEKLESVRELAQSAGVNPNTMQKALAELERQGLVFTNRTSGRFVTEDETHIQGLRREYAQSKIEEVTSKLIQLGYNKEELIQLIHSSLS